MDAIDIAARLIGAFYVFGGVIALHAIARDALLDKAIASITLSDENPDEALKRRILTVASLLTAVSGGALVLMAGVAPWLFLLNLICQAGWLAYARKRFPPADEDEGRGRRQVANAALVWGVITAIVIWLDFDGRLGSPADPWPPLMLAAGGLGLLVWIARHLAWKPARAPAFETDEPESAEPPARVRLSLRYGYQTFWDADDGRALNPYDHLPTDLATRLLVWEDRFHVAVDPADPDAGPRFSPQEALAHAAEGRAIAAELTAIFGEGAVEGPVLETEPAWPDQPRP